MASTEKDRIPIGRVGSEGVTDAVPSDWAPDTAVEPTALAASVDRTLRLTAELARLLVGAHQAAATLIVAGDWPHARKWFSLSPKYAAWFAYRTPAVGIGLHALVVADNAPLRLTETELEAHPAWQDFGREAGKHPPLRGWLAVPLVGPDGRNYGLLQLSDKEDDADFSTGDEERLTQLAALIALTLDRLRVLHGDERIGQHP